MVGSAMMKADDTRKRLIGWSARRAGGRITISASDAMGRQIKIVGVDVIKSGNPYPIATDKDGVEYALVPSIG